MSESTSRSHALVWLYVGFALLFIYLPILPPLVFSFGAGEAGARAFTLSQYAQMWRNPLLTNAIVTSIEVGAIVALITPVLGLAAAMAIRELPTPRLILSLVLLPLFIPGVSAGLATALFFRLVGIPPSLGAIGGRNTVQTYIWATYKQVGLSPTLYALMGLLIVLTLILIAAFLVVGAWRRPG
jgi:ABC-type spermidine/putrescine transport system permease subunit II